MNERAGFAAYPAPMRGWVAGFVGSSVVAVVACWSSGPAVPGSRFTVVATLLCAVGAAASELGGHRLGHRRQTSQVTLTVTSVFVVAAGVLLPTAAIAAVCLAGPTIARLHGRRPWHKCAYNVAILLAEALTTQQLVGLVLQHRPVSTVSPGRALAAAVSVTAALVVVDVLVTYVLLHLHGVSVPRRLERSDLLLVPVIGQVTVGLLSAAAWLRSPVLVVVVLPLLTTLQRNVSYLTVDRASRSDTKTELANAGEFRRVAERERVRALRTGSPLSVVLLDIDYLRRINNTFGHLAGDAAIVAVADALTSTVRGYDVAARFGGEEFAVLLPNTPVGEAANIAERVRAALARVPLAGPDVPAGEHVTVSAGVADLHGDEGIEQLLRRADHALYQSKSAGRDRVTSATLLTTAAP